MAERTKPTSDRPVIANFDSSHLTIGAGVAIFHLASSRVVLCWHSAEKYWFLPKGRRDASEDTGAGAEREGFEEVTTPRQFCTTLALIIYRAVWLPEPTTSHPSKAPPAASSQSIWRLDLAVRYRAHMDAAGAADGDLPVHFVLVCCGNGASGGGSPTR